MNIAEGAGEAWATWVDRQIRAVLREHKGIEDADTLARQGRLVTRTVTGLGFSLEVVLDGDVIMTLSYK